MAEPMSLDLYADPIRADPYPLLAELREAAPVHWVTQGGLESWIVTRYDEGRAMSAAPRCVKRRATGPEAGRKFKAALEEDAEGGSRSLLARAPPDPARLRRLVGKAFTPRRMDGLRS